MRLNVAPHQAAGHQQAQIWLSDAHLQAFRESRVCRRPVASDRSDAEVLGGGGQHENQSAFCRKLGPWAWTRHESHAIEAGSGQAKLNLCSGGRSSAT